MKRRSPIILGMLSLCAITAACRGGENQPAPPPTDPAMFRVEPTVLELPETLMEGLDGKLVNPGRVWVYFDSLNLLVQVHAWEQRKLVENSAKMFARLVSQPQFEEAAKFWTIQTDRDYSLPEFHRLVISIRPEDAKGYAESGDLQTFFLNAAFVKVDDVPYSLTKDQRLDFLKGRTIKAPSPVPPEER